MDGHRVPNFGSVLTEPRLQATSPLRYTCSHWLHGGTPRAATFSNGPTASDEITYFPFEPCASNVLEPSQHFRVRHATPRQSWVTPCHMSADLNAEYEAVAIDRTTTTTTTTDGDGDTPGVDRA